MAEGCQGQRRRVRTCTRRASPPAVPMGPDPCRRAESLQAGPQGTIDADGVSPENISMPELSHSCPSGPPPSRARMLQRGPRTDEPIAWAGRRGGMRRPSFPVSSLTLSPSLPMKVRQSGGETLRSRYGSGLRVKNIIIMTRMTQSRPLFVAPERAHLPAPLSSAPAAHAMGSQVVGPSASKVLGVRLS